MVRMNIDEIEQNLSAFLRRVEAGETFLITKNGQPVAEINPHASFSDSPRPFGLCAGEFAVPDDFDASLPENVLKEFEGR
jgi:prevent-host-death family protein